MNSKNSFVSVLAKQNLVLKIAIGIVLGALVGGLIPEVGKSVSILGGLFVSALKAIAPILIFLLVIASLATHREGQKSHMRPILGLYLLGTLAAATTAVLLSFLFPTTLTLVGAEPMSSAPQGIGEVLNNLLFKIFDNPVNALMSANYVGILAWAIGPYRYIWLSCRHHRRDRFQCAR
jgi:serine/threonine transporter